MKGLVIVALGIALFAQSVRLNKAEAYQDGVKACMNNDAYFTDGGIAKGMLLQCLDDYKGATK